MAEAGKPSAGAAGEDTMAEGWGRDKHFVDRHRVELIQRVKKTAVILDELFSKNVIQPDSYEKIRALPTSQEIMRELFNRPLASSGVQGKEIFYEILNKHESHLIDELRGREYESAMKVDTVMAEKMIFEALDDLSSKEFDYFKSLIKLEEDYPPISRSRLTSTDALHLLWDEEFVDLKEMNRTDLVQRLSDTSSGSKEKQWPSLIQRVETMTSVIELLLETLADLSDGEIKKFKNYFQDETDFNKRWSSIQWRLLKTTDRQDVVFLMVQIDGRQSVKMTKEALEKMRKTDLVQRLSDSSSGPKKKHSVDERLSTLIHKVAAMRAVKELLLETLSDLSFGEFKKFKWLLQFTFFQRSLELISWSRLLTATGADLVDVMLERCGQQSVKVTEEVLMDMNRTDLVQRLSETNSGHKAAGSSAEAFGVSTMEGGKHFVDECGPELIQKVETMTSVIEPLLETLAGLSDGEISIFNDFLLRQTDLYRRCSEMSFLVLQTKDRQDIVFLMVLTEGQQSVETTKEALKRMKRTDLVQRLSDSSSGPKKKHSEEHQSALIQKVATMAAVKQLLLETLNDLSDEEIKNFKWSLKLIVSQKNLPHISPELRQAKNRAEIVDVMLQTYSQLSVQLTREAVKKINRTDLMQRLSKLSSELKKKGLLSLNASDCEELKKEHQSVLSEKADVKLILFKTLKKLSREELKKFKLLLQFTYFQKGLPLISWRYLCRAKSAKELVDLMVENQQSVEVTTEVFMDMNGTDLVKKLSVISSRIKEKPPSEPSEKINGTDLVEMLSETSSGLKGPSRSLELEGCGSIMQDSSDWTKVEPEVNSADADEASIYSLQSEAGHFECSVSGLRWVCKEKVSFKYQFCSLSGHMERIESMQYMPAGPLMDVTVIAGKLDVVYLPHWICIDDDPTILDKFAVLHIDDCEDVVEKVSEVTSSHVKLSEPVFSPKMVLLGLSRFPVKVRCMVLIYSRILTESPQTSLTLHVYLLPRDRGVEEKLDSSKKSIGFNRIQKSKPQSSLKLRDWFILTTDQDGAEIYPEGEKPQTLKLRNDSNDPNFYEVIVKNPDKDFKLMLTPENGRQPVWACKILQGEWQNTSRTQENHSVDKQQAAITVDGEKLLDVLKELTDEHFKEFKWHLKGIKNWQPDNTDRVDLVTLMLQTYTHESVKVTKEALEKIPRNDLVVLLSETSS